MSKMKAHTALADGEQHDGDELDCAECIAALKQPLSRSSVDSSDPSHVISTAVSAYGDGRPGGTYATACSCGWKKIGKYARDGIATEVARRLAAAWAAEHRRNPLKEA